MDLLQRAQLEKYQWIQGYIARGSPRGQLHECAREYAKAAGLPDDAVPPYKTLYHWVRRYKTYGMLGLVDAVRSDAGRSRTMSSEAESLLEAYMRASRDRSPAAAIDFLSKNLPPEDPIPGYDTVRRWVRDFEANEAHTLKITEGLPRFRNEVELSMPGDLPRGGFRLAIDSTVADQWIRIPSPTEPGEWKAVRPALTVVEDVGSRLVVTFGLSLVAVNPHLMLAFLRRALIPGANYPGLLCSPIPEEIVTDAGSEHRGELEEALKHLGVRIRGRTPNRPKQNARVERVIQSLQIECLPHLPGYSKTEKVFDPYASPDSEVRRSLRSLEYEPYRKEIHPSSLPTLPELEAEMLAWVQTYNVRGHPALRSDSPEVRSTLLESKVARDTAEEAA